MGLADDIMRVERENAARAEPKAEPVRFRANSSRPQPVTPKWRLHSEAQPSAAARATVRRLCRTS